MKKIELLAPAGDFEKLEIAIHFGADAVYLAGKNFSLRNFSGNFSENELFDAVSFAHKNNIKVYIACNIYPRNSELQAISEYLGTLKKIHPDGIILADPGLLHLSKKILPDIPIHLSTQANTTHLETALFWKKIGVKRINAARELSLDEIREIADKSDMEIEAFVHGAMCIAYSGRCLLSSYLANRDGNRGMCAHPCRWEYAVVEKTRPDHPLPFSEDNRGAYIFSSKDLCMIEHIPDMITAGINSLKIEGRMKGIHYLATVVKSYREAINRYYEAPDCYSVKNKWIKELNTVNHRGYCTGFYFGDPDQVLPNYTKSTSFDTHLFAGKILGSFNEGYLSVDVRNKLMKNDRVEILTQNGPAIQDELLDIMDQDGISVKTAQPGNKVYIKFNRNYAPNDIIRNIRGNKKSEEKETGD